MDIALQDYHKLPFSKLFCDFIDNRPETIPFFSHQHQYRQLKDAVSSYRFPGDRAKSAEIIQKFNENFTLDREAKENLDALYDDQTVTITTGQQVNLFGGPLYTVYKTISVVYLARLLSRDTGRKVVPVFWLADEDHDFEEIATIKLPDQQKIRSIQLSRNPSARNAAGSISVDDGFAAFRSEFLQSLSKTEFYGDIETLLQESYTSGRTFRHSFGEMMARIFSRHGLIFAGSNFKEAKVFTRSIFRTAIQKAGEISDSLSEQSRQLAHSYHQQAQVLDSLLFWHHPEEGRVRLVHENGRWSCDAHPSWSTEELIEKLESDPEKFSPNVFLRPIVQDSLIPNAAYIGGPAEIAYYGQMKKLYKLMDRPMPFIGGRLSCTLVEPPIARIMKGLPFEFSEYSGRIEDLEQQYLRKFGNPDLDQHFDHWKKEIGELSGRMTDLIGISDPGLRKHCQAITKDQQNAVNKLKKKMVHAVRQKEEVQIQRIRKVKNALFPGDRLQEREIAFIYYMNKYGPDLWDRVIAKLHEQEIPVFSRHLIITI